MLYAGARAQQCGFLRAGTHPGEGVQQPHRPLRPPQTASHGSPATAGTAVSQKFIKLISCPSCFATLKRQIAHNTKLYPVYLLEHDVVSRTDEITLFWSESGRRKRRSLAFIDKIIADENRSGAGEHKNCACNMVEYGGFAGRWHLTARRTM